MSHPPVSIPRYLFRVQLRSPPDSANGTQVRADGTDGNQTSGSVKNGSAQNLYPAHTGSQSFATWTPSFMYVVAHAQKATESSNPLRIMPVSEDDVEILALDTMRFPQNASLVSNTGPSGGYFLRDELGLGGRCSRTTLGELNALGLESICSPHNFRRRPGNEDQLTSLDDEARFTDQLLMSIGNGYVVPHCQEDKLLAAAVEMAKVFPEDMEIAMMLVFLSLCRPPPAQRVYEKIKYEFGGEQIRGSLAHLGLEDDSAMVSLPGVSNFLTLAVEIRELDHNQIMRDLVGFLKDVPVQDSHAFL